MSVRRWELWEGDHENGVGTSAFFPSTNRQARLRAMEEGLVKTWETEASSSNEAMQAQYDRMGFGTYRPMLREDGTPYPEDEDDEVAKGQEGEFFDAWSSWCSVAQKRVLVPCDLDDEEIIRQGGFDWDCSGCGGVRRMTFAASRRKGGEPPREGLTS